MNSAGESLPVFGSIRIGSVPTVPLDLNVMRVVPGVEVELGWNGPEDNGCLPITSFVLNRNGVDLVAVIGPEQTTYVDAVTATIGTLVTYKLKALNLAGSSPYTQTLSLTISSPPNPPLNPRTISLSQTQFTLAWDPETAIPSNLPTISYRVYVDDLQGNGPEMQLDTGIVTSQAVVTGLTTGIQYVVTVVAVNQRGESLSSVGLTVYAGTVPSRIQSVTLLSSTTTSISLGWSQPLSNGGLPLAKFILYHDIGQTGTFTAVDINDPT